MRRERPFDPSLTPGKGRNRPLKYLMIKDKFTKARRTAARFAFAIFNTL
jgi:hypothetical protein